MIYLFFISTYKIQHNTDVCVRFAEEQPAPRGNIVVHCGGPMSLSSCVYGMGEQMYEYGYNVIGFDQVITLPVL